MPDPTHRLPPSVLRSERSHRRTVLLGVAVLLVLGMSPIFVHHLPIALGDVFGGRDHLWALCLVALHAILDPVHGVFHLLFFAGLGYASWDRLRAWRAFRRTVAPLHADPPRPGGAIGRAAALAGVDPGNVLVVPGLPLPAFTAGWLRPRIYVSHSLGDALTEQELAAVLSHEGAHVARRDPLRLSLLRFLACTLFWVPALRRLAADIADEGEVRADDVAAGRHGLALASALVRLGTWQPHPVGSLTVGFTGGDLLERRVLRLTGEELPLRSRVTRRSLMGAALALFLAWSSAIAVAHPLSAHQDGHCDLHGRAAVFHLFCRAGINDCPHLHDMR